jgi:hypothetical protein
MRGMTGAKEKDLIWALGPHLECSWKGLWFLGYCSETAENLGIKVKQMANKKSVRPIYVKAHDKLKREMKLNL